ncbi:MAG: DUF3313 domain-containing protein [Gammaproteobacteria bacterium]|nr:DUF3313 domain-containing protein [Gammaproteobacteria bacterium]
MKKMISAIIVSGILLTGCATNKVSEDKYSGFLNDYSILKTTPGDKDTLGYVTPNINWSKYSSIMVDKVLVITPDGEQKTDGQLLVAIADQFEELIKKDVSKEFNVVDNPSEGTIRLQAAITSVFDSYDDMKGYQYIPIAAAVVGAKRASGSEKKSVRVMTEFRLVDSVDGQLLGQVVDFKSGERKQDKDSAILLADVMPILEQWAQRITDRLIGLKKSL